MVKNLPGNAGDMGSMPGQGAEIPLAQGSSACALQLPRPHALEPACQPQRAHAL